MADVASLEQCTELYQASNGSWDDTDKVWCPYSVDGGATTQWQVEDNDGRLYDWPAYDLGYLLRKLPESQYEETRAGRISGSGATMRLPLVLTNVGEEWEIGYHDNDAWSAYIDDILADTPEDAAAKLAIELFKQGILKKEQS